MNETHNTFRPTLIREIARWWQRRLDEAAVDGEGLNPPSDSYVMDKFQCSEEEALRGIGVGEQLHWGGS